LDYSGPSNLDALGRIAALRSQDGYEDKAVKRARHFAPAVSPRGAMMNGSKYPRFRAAYILAVFVACLLAMNALAWGTIEGQVLDDETDQPVPGAIVVAAWNAVRSNWATDAHSVCLHVETAMADASGHYRLQEWQGWSSPSHRFLIGRSLSLLAYKSKYEPSSRQRPTAATIYLKPFRGASDQWFNLSWGQFDCSAGTDDSRGNLFRVFSAIATDARSLANTRQDRDRADYLEQLAEDYLVNRTKPTKYDPRGRLVNVDPNDSYKREELLK
jgi:hypothetical protein